jgi:transcriptional regulator with XRE-family HTH domain
MPAKIGPRKPVRKFIAEHREAKGLTQKQLAERLGCDEMTVSRWENDKTRVDMDTLQAIAEALAGDMMEGDDLLHHPDEPSPNQLLRALPAEDRDHFIKNIKSLLKKG